MPRTASQKPSRVTWSAALAAALIVPTLTVAQDRAAKTHTVRKGDTLWDLARLYRRDPFLWPDIYRINTDVVEDPHWIYPGEVLRLSGADNVRAVPSENTPTPTPVPADSVANADQARVPSDTAKGLPDIAVSDTAGYVPLFPTGVRQRIIEETLRAYTDQPYRALRRSEFFSSGFLTEDQHADLGTILGPTMPSQIPTLNNRDVVKPYATVGIRAPAGATYRVGDTLLVARIGDLVEGFGNMVHPSGLARITEAVDSQHYTATVVAVYGTIRNGQRLLPAGHFVPAGNARAQPVTSGVQGRVLGGRGRQEIKAPQMVVFIDKGRQDGVAPGDLFEARRRPRVTEAGALRVDDVMAEFQIVRVGERSATARVLNVLSPNVPPGTEVRQVAKLP